MAMQWYEILIGVSLIVASVVIVILVLMQQSREAGLSGVIAGGADTFFGKNKGRTMDAKLAKLTKIISVIFFVVVVVSTLLFAYMTSSR